MKVLLDKFHLNGHTLGFHPQTQKVLTTSIDSRFVSGIWGVSERVNIAAKTKIVTTVVQEKSAGTSPKNTARLMKRWTVVLISVPSNYTRYTVRAQAKRFYYFSPGGGGGPP